MPQQPFNFSAFFFTYYAYGGTFATYAALFFAARGLSVSEIGILVSLIPVMRIFGPNLWGWVADHTGKRAGVLRLTALAALLSFCGMFFAETFTQFFIIMVAVNLFTSAQSPLCDALLIADMRGDLANYGKVRLWGSIGFILAVMLTGYLLDWFGLDALLWFCVVMLVFVVGAALRIRDTPHPPATAETPRLRHVLRKPEVVAFFLSAALMCGAHMALYAFYSLYLERAGYSKPVIGVMWAIGVVVEVVFFYYQARVFSRYGARRIMLFAFGVAVVRFALMGAAPDIVWLLVVAQVMHAATFAAHHSASVITMQRWFSGPLQASGQTLYMSVAYGVGCSAGGLVMTLCWDRIGPQQMFYAAAVISAVGALVAWYGFRCQERHAGLKCSEH